MLESLSHRVAGARRAEIHDKYESTLQWLFDPNEVGFVDWLGQGSDYPKKIFWIQGKPGSGKSTLMKMALEDERTVELLRKGSLREHSVSTSISSIESCNSSIQSDKSSDLHRHVQSAPVWVKAGFFFHNRGIDMQKSLIGMMQDLLFQVLEKFNSLVDLIYPIYVDLSIKNQTNRPPWSLTALNQAWRNICKQEKIQSLRLILFLDALDEHEPSADVSNERLVELITELAAIKNENTVVLFCVASRPCTAFKTHFRGHPGFTMQDHTKRDIEIYTRRRILPNLDSDSASSVRWGCLIDSIVDKASGVFIWVRLVVDEMIKAVKDGTPFADLEEQLRRTPDELGELYWHAIKRIEPAYHLEAYIIIQLVTYARKPLPLETLYECVYYLKHGSHSDYPASTEEMRLFLSSRSGGLLETISRKSPQTALQKVPAGNENLSAMRSRSTTEYVQPIHQTVKDFVIRSTKQWPMELTQGGMAPLTGFLYLLKCATKRSRHPSTNDLQSDFLHYARRAELMPGHLSPTEVSHHIQSAFHELLTPIDSQQRIQDWSESHQVFRAFPVFHLSKVHGNINSLSLLAVTTAAGIGSFPARFKDESGFVWEHLKEAHEQYGRLESCDVHPMGGFLYHLAASAAICLPDDGNVEPLEALKAAEKVLEYPSHKKALDAKSNVPLCFSKGSTSTIVNLLNVTPLSSLLLANSCTRASSEGRLHAARYLLESGADPHSEILVDWPAGSPKKPTLQYRQTCLHHCARFESSSLVKLFLQYKANPYLEDSMKMTPLMYAALRNDRDVTAAFCNFGFEPHISSPSKKSSVPLESQVIWPWLLIPMQIGSAFSGRSIFRQRMADGNYEQGNSYYYYSQYASVSTISRY